MAAPVRIAARAEFLRLVVTSDNHLGRYQDRLPPARLEERRRSLRRSFSEVVEGALTEPADLFLQTGDLFDTPDPRNAERVFVAGELARLGAAGIPVLAIGGNHDTPRQRLDQGGLTPQEVFARLGALTLLNAPGAIATAEVAWGDRRVAIGGLTWDPTREAGQDPLRDFAWHPSADLRVLLFHHSIEGHIYPGANEPIVTLESLGRLTGVSLAIAGHVHRPATIRLPDRVVLIPGATERLTFGHEEGEPGYWVIELNPLGGVERLDHRPVRAQPRRELLIAPADLPADDPGAALRDRLATVCRPDTLVRLRLVGPILRDVYQALDLRRLIQFGFDRAFAIEIETSELYLADERGAAAARGVRLSPAEEITRVAEELDLADPDPRWAAARDLILSDLR